MDSNILTNNPPNGSTSHQRTSMYSLAGGVTTSQHNLAGGVTTSQHNLTYTTTPEKSGRSDLQADTPPQTPPNKLQPSSLNMGLMGQYGGVQPLSAAGHISEGANNVINPGIGSMDSLSRYQYPHQQQHGYAGSPGGHMDPVSSMAQYHQQQDKMAADMGHHSHQYESLAGMQEDCYNS